MAIPKQISFVTFDVYGTLIDWALGVQTSRITALLGDDLQAFRFDTRLVGTDLGELDSGDAQQALAHRPRERFLGAFRSLRRAQVQGHVHPVLALHNARC